MNERSRMKENTPPRFNKMAFYFNCSLIGTFRGGATLFMEHPLDSIKTQWQDQVNVKSIREIVRNIYTNKGIMGFYNGFVPNFIRVTSKHFYRWPLMIFFPKFYEMNLPKSIKNSFSSIHKILTGLTIANIEIFIFCPLDRLKIFFMTSTHLKSNSSKFLVFYRTFKNNLLVELFRGLEPTFWRSNVSWVTFLYLDFELKKLFRNLKGEDFLTFYDLFLVSIFVGVGNVLAIMPFDFVKTQMQKEGSLKDSTFNIIRTYSRQYGMKILYIGWQFKMLQYVIQSIFTVFTMDRLEIMAKHI